MIYFFENPSYKVFAVQTQAALPAVDIEKLNWLLGDAKSLEVEVVDGCFVGPRATMISPWSTNAVEITQNMCIEGILRIEEYQKVAPGHNDYDVMLLQKYTSLNQELFTVHASPQPMQSIDDIAAYNEEEGLALSAEEVAYLEQLVLKINRKLTDSEVFGFSQVNSEHCRHKIFNGTFVIDGEEQQSSLFSMIKETSKRFPNGIVSAYKDNVAFVKGPLVTQFAPKSGHQPDYYEEKQIRSVLSLKAETHNFPTTVEAFNGAATGAGGEIRDRLAGGQGALPLAGTAVYMTPYSRLEQDRTWEEDMPERKWLYQSPLNILIKASNGASDFGNKFGQPLIAGSILTFEHEEHDRKLAFDKVVMLAGGIGYGKEEQALKLKPKSGDAIVVLGGENYRIGMGGAAVSSADTGAFGTSIEMNAIQRSNPEMQKRVANTVRAMVEQINNPVISIHDHGAGGHLNCLSELVEEVGGHIDLDKLPVGDSTLSAKEIIGNESQERMGLVIGQESIEELQQTARRERAPMYIVGEVTDDHHFIFTSAKNKNTPMDFDLADMFGSSPKTVLQDHRVDRSYDALVYEADIDSIKKYLHQVLQLEAVACKDWLTNKVDRCVGGLVAKQQCAGPLQLPLNNCGVMALDYHGQQGLATSIGHAPVLSLIDPVAGSKQAIAEALSNIIWAPLEEGLTSVSLSANWMWPSKNEGEDARLYDAVKACSEFAIDLGINIPTGKDSLSMKQKYSDGDVISPGTVIISAAGHCSAVRGVVEPVLRKDGGDLYYINLSQDALKLGGSSFAQILKKVGKEGPTIQYPASFKSTFNVMQELIKAGKIQAGHDVGSGGLITTLLEMCFADIDLGATIDLTALNEPDLVKVLFSENIALVFQADASAESVLTAHNIDFIKIGTVESTGTLTIVHEAQELVLDVAAERDVWYKTSYLLDQKQSGFQKAKERFDHYKKQPLVYAFPNSFNGKKPLLSKGSRPKAAIIREKGSNSEREMANAMYLAGFDVKDVHMTDLISGRELLEDIQFIGAVGGFSNSDVLGSAKGWAGAFLYNERANETLVNFFKRTDTLSVGICNGCQLFLELELLNQDHAEKPKMHYNDSHKHESGFVSVKVQENNSVMLSSLAGSTLGVWISHGEGKFHMPNKEQNYHIVAKYAHENYPANPNGSDYNTAMLCDHTGRHLVTMPHIERSTFPWNWAHYPNERKQDEVSPWLQAFVNARLWIEHKNHQS